MTLRRSYGGSWLVRVVASLAFVALVAAPAAAQDGGDEPAEEQAELESDEEPAEEEPADEEPADEEPADEEQAEGEPADLAAEGDAADGDDEPIEVGPAVPRPSPLDAPDGDDAVASDDSDYSEEALALLPKEVLDALPKALTRFLRPKDYSALKAVCPQEDLAQVLDCIGGDAAGRLLETEYPRALVSTLLGYMDAELPERLTDDELDAIMALCDKAGEAWADCAVAKDADHPDCEEPEDALASCVVANDRVVEVFLAIQKERKTVFGPDFYVQFRGFLAVLPMAALTELRAACPQDDMDAVLACLDEHPLVGTMVDAFQEAAVGVVTEAQSELTAAGKPLTDEQVAALTERVTELLFRLPLRVIDNLDRECKRLHPETEVLDDPAKIDLTLTCFDERSDLDPIANPVYISKEQLRAWITAGKEKVVTKLRDKELTAQSGAFDRVLLILAVLAGLGVFVILLTPLRLGGRYPDRKPLLWKASGFAALTFVLTLASLGVTLLAMRTVQGTVAVDTTSPKMRIAHAVFDVLGKEHQVELLSDLSKERLDFIKTPLQALVKGTGDPAEQEAFVAYVALHWATLLEEPELAFLAKNATMLKSHAAAFKGAVGYYEKVDWVMGYVPILLALLAVLLYLLPMKETLLSIVSAPARAARGDDPNAFADAIHTVKGEFKLIVPYLGVMLLFIPVVGVFIALAVEPLVELLLGYFFQTLFYLLGAEASALVLDLSLGGAMLLLVACIAVFVLAMSQLLGTLRKVLRARFHWGHPLSRYGRFFKLAPLASLAVLAFPVAFAFGIHYVAFDIVEPRIDWENITTLAMLGIPVGGLLAFPVLLFATRMTRLMRFVGKYPVTQDDPTPAPVPADAAARSAA